MLSLFYRFQFKKRRAITDSETLEKYEETQKTYLKF
jgi:hypothetical protein